MPIPTSVNDLSTTAESNSPTGSDSPSQIDNYIRSHASIIRQVSDAKADLTDIIDYSASSGSSLVGFLQSGTGAVATTVQAKLRESVSVKDFGAVGDGVADDTVAIQSAIDAGKTYLTTTSGREIYFPPGRYKVTTIDLTACHGVHLVGAGAYATEIFTSGTNQVIKAIGSSSAPLNKAGVKNMTIRGGGKANTSAHGIDLQWANTCYLENLVFFGCRNALNLAHQWQTYLTNISVHGGGADQSYIGVFMDATDLTYIDNAVIASGVVVQSTSGYGFRIINGQGSKFVNCEAGGNPMVYAWYIGDPPSGTVPCQWLHISNCLGDSTTGTTWLIRQGTASELSQIQISNCWAGNGDKGFYLDGLSYSALTNLLSVGHASSAIVLNQCAYVTVSNSVFKTCNENLSVGVYDIALQSSTYCTINGCTSEPLIAGKSLVETGSSNTNTIYGNNLFQGMTLIGANTQAFRNIAAKTENKGQIDLLSGTTSIVVSHGLVVTPDLSCISVTPKTGIGLAKSYWITTPTATTFTINVDANPGANIGFCWNIVLSKTQ